MKKLLGNVASSSLALGASDLKWQHLLRAGCDVFVFYRRSFHATHSAPESAAAALIARTPLGCAGHREPIARAVFLASEYDRCITGTTMIINGGVYAA